VVLDTWKQIEDESMATLFILIANIAASVSPLFSLIGNRTFLIF
jgi:hypothetical protein